MKYHVLCVEDDIFFHEFVKATLAKCDIEFATTIKEARNLIKQKKYNAYLIDIGLDDGNGLELLADLMADKSLKGPVIMLTGADDVPNKVTAYNLGVDDYITKPFHPLEFESRIMSKIYKYENRNLGSEEHTKKIGDVLIDMDRQKVFGLEDSKKVDLDLTHIELRLLVMFSGHIERVFTREELLQNIWGDVSVIDRTVDSHVAHLRKKLEPTQLRVKTAKNIGYSLYLVS